MPRVLVRRRDGHVSLRAARWSAAALPVECGTVSLFRCRWRRKAGPRLISRATDFQLLDNGVAQSVTASLIERLPLDVTLVLDTSGSVAGRFADLKTQLQQISDLLRPNDRLRLIAFTNTAVDVFGLQPGGARLPLERLAPGGSTSFYEAIAAALMAIPNSERPQLVFAFSDGMDTTGFLDADRVVSLAGHTNAALYVGLVHSPPPRRNSMTPYEGGPNVRLLREATARTGGALIEDSSGAKLAAVFGKLLDEFRAGSYLLTYTPQGVARNGWHDIVVNVRRPGTFEIRARKGYDGG